MIRFGLFTLFSIIFILGGCQQQSPSSEAQSTSDISSTQGTTIYLDVRTQEERDVGHVSGAIHLPLARIQAGEQIDLQRDREIIIYCRSGNRSSQAIKILQEQGYTNLVNGGAMSDLTDVEIVSSS